MVINICDKYTNGKISIYKFDNDKYNVKYSNKIFVMDPKISFKNHKLNYNSNKDSYYMKFNFDMEKEKHINFNNLIRDIYDDISECIELDDDINIFEIKNPILKSINTNKPYIYSSINKGTQIINYSNDEKMEINTLKNKIYDCYPIFYSPNISIYDEKAYVNISLYKIYINLKEYKEYDNISYEPNKQEMKIIMEE